MNNTNNQEIWKDVPEWENLYCVSNMGRIFSKRYNRIKAQTMNNNGYARCDLFSSASGKIRRKSLYTHQLVATLFVKGKQEGLVVDHIDGDKTNNMYTNLRWVTQSENIKKGYRETVRDPSTKFKKQPVYITTEPKVYFDSMTECAHSLGLPVERIKTVLRFYSGKLPELGIRVVRCECPTTNPDECKGVDSSESKSGTEAQSSEDIV